MSSNLVLIIVVGGIVALFGVGLGMLIAKFYRKVEQGKALIVNKMTKDPEVTFTGAVVLPIVHKAETMEISVKKIEIDRRGKEGLICQDNIRADIKVVFFVRVNKTRDDVIKVAQSIGCARASDQETLEALFSAKFSEALKTVGKQLDFVDLYTQRNEFRDQIVEVIGRDLNGYVLEDAAIDFLEQTPLSSLDPHNILDAQGIRKITELTAIEHVRTNQFQNQEKKSIRKQDVEATEAILELDRQKADAESKQKREIATVRAREEAETEKVASEERLKSSLARIKADEEIEVNEQNKSRQVAVAEKNRERVIAVEGERVERDRALEAIARERDVELLRIAKEKSLELERKEIQDVIRERIAVEKTVAEEEERIKDVRVIEQARRLKQSAVIAAEAEAEQQLVKDIKAAEAAETASKHRARERLTLADAELEASEREAKAKIRLAEGIQAESAATGLAAARVKEADAIASEKHGLADARVKEADAIASEKQGLADARVREADAVATAKVGAAEATALRDRMTAEAAGLTEKAKSIHALDEAGRDHEEYRLRIDNERTLGMEALRARQHVAENQAKVLSEALKTAKIDIVGGDGAFLDRMVNAIGMGKAVDHVVDRSDTVSSLLRRYLDGDRSVAEDLKSAVSPAAAETVKDLTISALLLRLMSHADGAEKDKFRRLLQRAKSLGVEERGVAPE